MKRFLVRFQFQGLFTNTIWVIAGRAAWGDGDTTAQHSEKSHKDSRSVVEIGSNQNELIQICIRTTFPNIVFTSLIVVQIKLHSYSSGKDIHLYQELSLQAETGDF